MTNVRITRDERTGEGYLSVEAEATHDEILTAVRQAEVAGWEVLDYEETGDIPNYDDRGEKGHPVSDRTVARMLQDMGFSLQGNAKVIEGKQHADRDAQFRYLAGQVGEHVAAGQPVVSVDVEDRVAGSNSQVVCLGDGERRQAFRQSDPQAARGGTHPVLARPGDTHRGTVDRQRSRKDLFIHRETIFGDTARALDGAAVRVEVVPTNLFGDAHVVIQDRVPAI